MVVRETPTAPGNFSEKLVKENECNPKWCTPLKFFQKASTPPPPKVSGKNVCPPPPYLSIAYYNYNSLA